MSDIFHNFKDRFVKSQVIEGIAFNVEKLAKEMQKTFQVSPIEKLLSSKRFGNFQTRSLAC